MLDEIDFAALITEMFLDCNAAEINNLSKEIKEDVSKVKKEIFLFLDLKLSSGNSTIEPLDIKDLFEKLDSKENLEKDIQELNGIIFQIKKRKLAPPDRSIPSAPPTPPVPQPPPTPPTPPAPKPLPPPPAAPTPPAPAAAPLNKSADTTDPQSGYDKQSLQEKIALWSNNDLRLNEKQEIQLLAAKKELTKIEKQELKEQLEELRAQAPKDVQKIKKMEKQFKFLQAKHLAAKGLFALLTDDPILMKDHKIPNHKASLFHKITSTDKPEEIITEVDVALAYVQSLYTTAETLNPGNLSQMDQDWYNRKEIEEVRNDLAHLSDELRKKYDKKQITDGSMLRFSRYQQPPIGNLDTQNQNTYHSGEQAQTPTLLVRADSAVSGRRSLATYPKEHDDAESVNSDNISDISSEVGEDDFYDTKANTLNRQGTISPEYELYLSHSAIKGPKKHKDDPDNIASFGGLEERVKSDTKKENRIKKINNKLKLLKGRQERTREIQRQLGRKLGQAVQYGQEQELKEIQQQQQELKQLKNDLTYTKTKAQIYNSASVQRISEQQLQVTIPNKLNKFTFQYDMVQETDGSLKMTTNNLLSDINQDHTMIVQFIDNAIKAGKSRITVNNLYKPNMSPSQRADAENIAAAFQKYCRLADIKCTIYDENYIRHPRRSR
jgi:hypothetical protein